MRCWFLEKKTSDKRLLSNFRTKTVGFAEVPTRYSAQYVVLRNNFGRVAWDQTTRGHLVAICPDGVDLTALRALHSYNGTRNREDHVRTQHAQSAHNGSLRQARNHGQDRGCHLEVTWVQHLVLWNNTMCFERVWTATSSQNYHSLQFLKTDCRWQCTDRWRIQNCWTNSRTRSRLFAPC